MNRRAAIVILALTGLLSMTLFSGCGKYESTDVISVDEVVPVSEFEALQAEYDALAEENASLKVELERLKSELASLQAEYEAVKATEEELPIIEKPEVAFVPVNWYLSEDTDYPEYSNDENWGLVEYIDEDDGDFVQIWYGDLPEELQGKERDGDALIGRAIYESVTFEPTDTGTMNIGSWLAGYSRAYDEDLDVYDIEIVFVYESTCIDIYACFDATVEDEEQAMSLIRSIYF